MKTINNPEGLIGDFLGTIPVMVRLAASGGATVYIHPAAEAIFDMIPASCNLQKVVSDPAKANELQCDYKIDLQAAFKYGSEHNLYMTQAHYGALGLDVPQVIAQAPLNINSTYPFTFDYIIAPFSRCLPDQQKWSRSEWQRLVDMMPDKSFCVIGSTADGANQPYLTGSNVSEIYGEPIEDVFMLLQKARKGLISVVSGPSHIAFHHGVKNYLITNQSMAWGNNPGAIKITDNIPDLKAETVKKVLDEN